MVTHEHDRENGADLGLSIFLLDQNLAKEYPVSGHDLDSLHQTPQPNARRVNSGFHEDDDRVWAIRHHVEALCYCACRCEGLIRALMG